MLPSSQYERAVADGSLESDPVQRALLPELDDFVQSYRDYYAGISREQEATFGFRWPWNRVRNTQGHIQKKAASDKVSGLYLWGSVGRGKTQLMEMVGRALPDGSHRFVHFNRFMDEVHELLRDARGEDPLLQVAEKLIPRGHCLLFDEFFVEEIADAMVLARLLHVLIETRGVVIVCTSNIAIEGLYANGLHRSRFMPAIDLLEQNMRSLALDGTVDYRKQQGTSNLEVRYLSPATLSHNSDIKHAYLHYCRSDEISPQKIVVMRREINVISLNSLDSMPSNDSGDDSANSQSSTDNMQRRRRGDDRVFQALRRRAQLSRLRRALCALAGDCTAQYSAVLYEDKRPQR